MKLPIIRSISDYIGEKDKQTIQSTIDVLEHLSQAKGMKDTDIDVIGELLSNLYGGLEVAKMIEQGQPQKEALNAFMQRVLGSIDK